MIEFFWMGIHYIAQAINKIDDINWDYKIKAKQNNKKIYVDSQGKYRRRDNDRLCVSRISSQGDNVVVDYKTNEIIVNNSENLRLLHDNKRKNDAVKNKKLIYKIDIPAKYKNTKLGRINCFYKDINTDEILVKSRISYPICDVFINPIDGHIKCYYKKNNNDESFNKYLNKCLNNDIASYNSTLVSKGIIDTVLIYSK